MAPVKDSYVDLRNWTAIDIVVGGEIVGRFYNPGPLLRDRFGIRTPDGIVHVEVEKVLDDLGKPDGLCAEVALNDAEKLFDHDDFQPI